MKLSRGEKIYVFFMNLFMVLFALICLLPVLNVFARSLSSLKAVAGGQVWFWPVEFNTAGWKYIIERTTYLKAMYNSIINTVTGTLLSLFVTVLPAYALSRTYLRGRRVVILLYVFMMIFHAGILPNYFQINEYGLINTRWALILPGLVSPYNTFVLKTSFENVPDSLEEAARIDGACFTRILWSIIIPVSKASIATIIIFTAVGYWNGYFNALLYITKQQLKPVALLLYETIKESATGGDAADVDLAITVSPDIKNASIVMLTVLPILVVYPFMQKYFVKGVMVGSVKG